MRSAGHVACIACFITPQCWHRLPLPVHGMHVDAERCSSRLLHLLLHSACLAISQCLTLLVAPIV